MKYINKKCREVLLIAVILQLILVSFSWATLSEVALNFKSHEESEPTQLTEIKLNWNYTGGDTITGYYYALTNTSDYTLNDTIEPHDSGSYEIIRTKDDGEYYFYIAAYKVGTPPPTPPPNEMGPVTKYGPMIIDTRSPEIVTVIGPDNNTTDNSAINLDISVSDSKNENEMISEINISEGLPGNGTWEEFTPSNSINCSYDLKQGEGQYTLRIQVKDFAGNIADADPYPITYTTADDLVMAQYTSVPTLTEWGMILFMSMIIGIGIVATRRNVIVALK